MAEGSFSTYKRRANPALQPQTQENWHNNEGNKPAGWKW